MKMSIEQLRENLLEQWNNGLIKGISCPSYWNFNKFWYKFGQALYKNQTEENEGLEDYEILERIKEEAKSEVSVINGTKLIKCYRKATEDNQNFLVGIEELTPRIEKMTEVFNMIADSTRKIMKRKEEEQRILNSWDNKSMNILLGKTNLIRKEDFFPENNNNFFEEKEEEKKPNLFEEAESLIREAEQLMEEKGLKVSEDENLKSMTEAIKGFMNQKSYSMAIEECKKLIEAINKPKEEIDKSGFLSNAFQTLNPTEKASFLNSIVKRKLSKQGTQNMIPLEDEKTELSQQQQNAKKEYQKEKSKFGTIEKPTVEEQEIINQIRNFEEKGNYSMALAKLRSLWKLHENIIEINSP